MEKLFERFKILCTNFDLILEQSGETIQGGGYSSREDTNLRKYSLADLGLDGMH